MLTELLLSDGYSQIEEAILVDITHDDIPGVIANRVIRRRLKRAIAIAQENSDVIQDRICGYQILNAVAVEVADGEESRR